MKLSISNIAWERDEDEVDTSQPGVSASDKKVGAKSTAKRNVSKRAAGKSRAVLEDSQTGTPSRKSTRKSGTRTRSASGLEQQATRKEEEDDTKSRGEQGQQPPR